MASTRVHRAHRVDEGVVCVRVCGLGPSSKEPQNADDQERRPRERVDVVGLRLTRAMPHSDTSAVAATPVHPGYHITNNDVDATSKNPPFSSSFLLRHPVAFFEISSKLLRIFLESFSSTNRSRKIHRISGEYRISDQRVCSDRNKR